MNEEQIAIFKNSMDTLGKTVTKTEFLSAFKKVLEIVKNIKDSNTQEWNLIHDTVNKLSDKVMSDMSSETSSSKEEMMSYCKSEMDKMMKEHDAKMQAMDEKMDSVQDGEDGKSADEEKIVADVLAKVPTPPFLTSIEIRDRLEILKDNERLDISAIKGVDEIKKSIANIPQGRAGWGAHPLQIQDSGTVVTKVARLLNFIGATITQARDGTTTIAFSGAGFTTLAATETPNGVLTVFTFATASAQPSYIISDNVWLKAVSKSGTVNWTWNAGAKTATLTIPANDDIWAVV